jgi:hypothetical protein
MSQAAVARLENKLTHDAFDRKYHTGVWLDNCPKCDKIGVKGDALLMCTFCPNAFPFGSLGMDVRVRAPKGDWACPTWRTADDLTRLDERPRKIPRLDGADPRGRASLPTIGNTMVLPATTPPAVTEQLWHPLPNEPDAPPRGRGRPRKVVAIA